MGYIFWLASYPKSGNTWLRVFMRNLLDPARTTDINTLHQHFPYDVSGKYYRRLDPRPCNEYSRAETLAMRGRVQRMIAAEDPNITFVKTHAALVVEDGYHLIDPEATVGAVYIVRNPLDVAVSFSHHSGASIDATIHTMNMHHAVEAGGEHAAQDFFGSWSENVESWTRAPNPAIHVVRYEDMVERPIKTFSGIARALGVNPLRAALERALKRSSLPVLQAQEAARGFSERLPRATALFFRRGEPGDGARTLTLAQIDRLVAAHNIQMARFGYLP
jgi:hypothetical protein